MQDEVAEWKGRQRAAMAQQLQLEEESLARLEAAAANSEADAVKGSVHGGMFGGSEVDESVFDAPNMVKVGGSDAVQEPHASNDYRCAGLAARILVCAQLYTLLLLPTKVFVCWDPVCVCVCCPGECCVHGQCVGHQG
jgi:hypothetical protein